MSTIAVVPARVGFPRRQPVTVVHKDQRVNDTEFIIKNVNSHFSKDGSAYKTVERALDSLGADQIVLVRKVLIEKQDIAVVTRELGNSRKMSTSMLMGAVEVLSAEPLLGAFMTRVRKNIPSS